jgi:Bcr/CflA subfamily drug resistance transporter
MNSSELGKNSHPKRHFFAILSLLVIPISGLSVDIYVPSLPAIHQYFGGNQSLIQLTITTYIIGFGFSQLFVGNIVDIIGRKKPFLLACIFFIVITVLTPLSTNVYELLCLRFLQGIVVACLSVSMRAVIADLFEGIEFFKMMTYVTVAWAIGPIIAPAIGGYLQHYFGWHAAFYFLAIYGIIMLALNIMFMPETATHSHPFNMPHILHQYKSILFRLDFFIGIICLGLLYAMLVLFGIIAPFLIQVVMHYSVIQFGHTALLIGLAWFLGNMTNRFILEIPMAKKVKLCFIIMLITCIIMLLAGLYLPININSLVIPTFILLYFGGIVFPNYFAINIALFPESPATANSLTGAFMTLLAGVCSGLGALLESNTQIPLTLTYLTMVLICLFSCYFTSK